MVDHDDAVGEGVGFFQVLRGQEQGRTVADQLADDVPHAHPAGRVEPGGRFVEEQHRRAGDDTGGEIEPAAHAAGVGLRDAVGRVGEAEAFEQLDGPRLGRRAPQPAQLADHHEVLAPGERLVEGGILGRDPDVARRPGCFGHDVEAGDRGPAAVGHGQGREDPDRGGLARTVRPEHTEDRPGGHVEVDAGERDGLAVALGEAFGVDTESDDILAADIGGFLTGRLGGTLYLPNGKELLTGCQVE